MKSNLEIVNELETWISRAREASNIENDMARLMAMGSIATLEAMLDWIKSNDEKRSKG